MVSSLSKSPLIKYFRAVKACPREIFNRHLFVSVIAFALTGCSRGWDEGSAASITQLKSFKTYYGLNDQNSDEIISNVVSLVNIGLAIGALVSFVFNDRFGRIWSMRGYQMVYVIGSLISTVSYGNHGAIYFGRLVAGFGIGGTTVIGPMAIAELAPRTTRGLMTLWYNVGMLLAQMVGVFVVYGCNAHISGSKRLQYQVPFFVQVLVPAFSIGLSFFAVESPRWLAITNRQTEALQALLKLRGLPEGHAYVEVEYREIVGHSHDEAQRFGTGCWAVIKETLTVRSNIRRVWLTIIAYILAQFSGANSVTNYLPTILGLIGVKGTETKIYGTGLYALAKTICCIAASLVFVDVLGRRLSLMCGVTVQAMCMSYLAGYLKYYLADPDNTPKGATDGALAIIYIHALGWAIGLYSLPYLFGAELWPNRIRAFGGSLSQCFHWLFYFCITKATPAMFTAMDTWGTFVFFVGWCLTAFIYTYFFIPETNGLSLEAIDSIFEQPFYKMRRPPPIYVDQPGDDKPQMIPIEKNESSHVERQV